MRHACGKEPKIYKSIHSQIKPSPLSTDYRSIAISSIAFLRCTQKMADPGFPGSFAGHISGNVTISDDLILKSTCSTCRTSSDLYGTSCKHMTLCLKCGKSMAEAKAPCSDCGLPVRKLIREYNVRSCNTSEKSHFIGRFVQGLPNFSKKSNSDSKWTLNKGLKGQQSTETLCDKYKNKPLILEDEINQLQFQGQLEGAQNAAYYLLMMHGKEFVSIPAGPWYTFNKAAQYKQLTLEEAEEKMKARKKNVEGYQRWLMKTAKDGAAAFGEIQKMDSASAGGGGVGRHKKGQDDAEEAGHSDRGDEDEYAEEARKNKFGLNKKGGEEDEDGTGNSDRDIEEDDVEKGDDWEHEEVFTDDDEAVGNNAEEREDIGPEVPAPPEIKQDEEEEEEGNGEEGEGLSKSGKELKQLLGKRSANDSEEDDDEYEDADDDIALSPVLAPKQKVPKEEPWESTPTKEKPTTVTNTSPNGTKTAKGKRKFENEDTKPNAGLSLKKIKTVSEDSKVHVLAAVKEEKTNNSTTPTSQVPNKSITTQSAVAVTEDELHAIIKQEPPISAQQFVARYKARLKTAEDKQYFASTLKKVGRIQKTENGSFVVLREK